MSVASFTNTGAKASAVVSLPKGVFDLDVNNHDLLKQAYIAYQANGRLNLAKTLRRGEVSGGGKKPWRQKGTGNARTGSIRNPIWRGGGIVFGPLGIENYSKKLGTKATKHALRQALSLAVGANKLATIDKFVIETGKTADANKLIAKLGLGNRLTVVGVEFDDVTLRATNNLKDVNLVKANYLSVVDVLDAHAIVITKDALSALELRLGGAK